MLQKCFSCLNEFCCLRNGHSHQHLLNGVSTSPAALAKLSSSRGVTTAVGESYATDSEERTLDIVLGNDIANQQYKVLNTFFIVTSLCWKNLIRCLFLQLLKATEGSPASSLSLDDQMSDIGDPLHDESILNELFYRVRITTNHTFFTLFSDIYFYYLLFLQNGSDQSDLDLDLLAADIATTSSRSMMTSHDKRKHRTTTTNKHYAMSLEDSGNVVSFRNMLLIV